MKFRNVAMLVMFAFASNAMAVNGMFKTHFGRTTDNSGQNSSGNLLYYGGPVISKAKVYTVFWGANVSSTMKTEMPKFYASIVNSTYMDWMTEYNTSVNAVDGRAGTNQSIGRGSYAGTLTLTPSTSGSTIDDTEIQAELERQVKAGSIPAPDADTLYMIHFPSGLKITMTDGTTTATSCKEFCAYHNGFNMASGTSVYYGVIPDLGSASCSFGCGMGLNLMDRTTVSASHEFLEAVTDPFPTPGSQPSFPQAWNTSDGNEVADLCQTESATTLRGTQKSYKVSKEWDNSKSACTDNDWVGQ